MEEIKDTYYTIVDKAQGLYKEKGSKFFSYAFPVSNEDEVKPILQDLRKEFHDARHHCYAYVIGYDGERWRVNDDGEPSSTAGKPIRGQIISRNLTNTLVVVVRYFGGTKLGVSGLLNAYKAAAADALDAAKIVERTIDEIYKVSFAYPATNDMMRLINEEDLPIINQEFDASCSITVGVRLSKTELFLKTLDKIDSAVAEKISTD